MSARFVPRVGGILSADIAVPEHEREMRFYSRVLGTGDEPLWRENLMNNLGTPIIGLGERTAEYAELPLQWMPHIQVADVAASVQHALDAGGHELMHGKDDDGASQWAVLQDPNGAAFGLVPVASAEEILSSDGDAPSHNVEARIGCISGLELTASDASGTRDFYQQVVGWSVREAERNDAGHRYTDYTMCDRAGNPVARICHARGANLGVPPIWIIHLPVGDLAESLRRVHDEGGNVVRSTPRTDGTPPAAVIQDPVGACVALVQDG